MNMLAQSKLISLPGSLRFLLRHQHPDNDADDDEDDQDDKEADPSFLASSTCRLHRFVGVSQTT